MKCLPVLLAGGVVTYRSCAIDPSITATGWSVMEEGHVWVAGGLLKPQPRKGDAGTRIDSLCDQLYRLLDDYKPVDVVIEITSGHVNHGRHGGAGAGLGIYGMAVGELHRQCWWWASYHAHGQGCPQVHRAQENLWTGRKPKAKRVEVARILFPQYDPQADPGGDLADALMLNCWFQSQRKLEALQAMKYLPDGQ